MSRTVSAGLLKAMELIRTRKMSPWAAAKEAGIEDTTVYRSPLYLEYLNETDGPEKAAKAMERLTASPAWGGDQSSITPLSVAREMKVPVQLIYNAEAFQGRVMDMLGNGKGLEDIASELHIPIVAIKKLPRFLSNSADERLARALSILEESWETGARVMPQDVAKQIKIPVNLIYRSERFQKRVESLLKEGVSLRQISEQLGIGHRAIKALPVHEPYVRRVGRPRTKAKVETSPSV